MLNLLQPNNSQTLTLGANAVSTSTAIEALNIRISSQVGIHIAIGTAPTVTTSSIYLPAGISPAISIAMNSQIGVLNATSTADAKVTIFN